MGQIRKHFLSSEICNLAWFLRYFAWSIKLLHISDLEVFDLTLIPLISFFSAFSTVSVNSSRSGRRDDLEPAGYQASFVQSDPSRRGTRYGL